MGCCKRSRSSWLVRCVCARVQSTGNTQLAESILLSAMGRSRTQMEGGFSTDFCLESNRRLLHRSRIRESTVLACLIRPLLLLRLAFVAHALRLVQIGVAAYAYMQLLLISGAAQHLWPYAHAFGGQALPTLSSWQACRMTGLLRVPLHRIR